MLYKNADFNICHTEDDTKLKRNIKMAIKLGYDVIAVNVTDDPSLEVKAKFSVTNEIPQADTIVPNQTVISTMLESLGLKKDIRVLSRYTMVYSQPDQTRRIQMNKTLKTYDLLAVQPTTEATFKTACTTLNVHIISLDLSKPRSFRTTRALLGQAVNRGIVFEICYAPLLRDPKQFQKTVSNAAPMCEFLKGRNVIISSGCDAWSELRNPYDVQNLGGLFGLSPEHAKHSVTKNCMLCLQRAERSGDDIGKRVVIIERCSEQTPAAGTDDKDVIDNSVEADDADDDANDDVADSDVMAVADDVITVGDSPEGADNDAQRSEPQSISSDDDDNSDVIVMSSSAAKRRKLTAT